MQRFIHAMVSLTALAVMTLSTSSAHALSRKSFGRTRIKTNASTSGMFLDHQLWLPGSWMVNEGVEKLQFMKKDGDRTADGGKPVRTITVRVTAIPRTDCAYGIIRMRALKSWGGDALDQSQGRIENIRLGTLKFLGYTWVEPSTWKGDRHWCLGQDLKTAAEITAPEGDDALITFMRNDFLLQIAYRQGRSVLPWPTASGHSSTSP